MDAQTGVMLWSLNVREKFEGKGYGFGFDRVFFPAGGPTASLVALDANDGRTIWTAGTDPASYCPAFLILFNGRLVIVGYLENALMLVDGTTGKLLHRQSLSVGRRKKDDGTVGQYQHDGRSSVSALRTGHLQFRDALEELLDSLLRNHCPVNMQGFKVFQTLKLLEASIRDSRSRKIQCLELLQTHEGLNAVVANVCFAQKKPLKVCQIFYVNQISVSGWGRD
jgi:hypothetical protein